VGGKNRESRLEWAEIAEMVKLGKQSDLMQYLAERGRENEWLTAVFVVKSFRYFAFFINLFI
jgi:hypothetical protein